MMTETDTKPVAWMYRRMTTAEADHVEFTRARWSGLLPRWTETPLYAAPQPCTDCAALRDEVDRLRGALELAANRLERNAVDYIAAGDPHAYEQGEWADDARRAALNGGKDD